MATKAKETDLLEEIEKSIKKIMKETVNSAECSLTDKMKIIDRALKLEQVKHKMQDDGMGSGFHDED